MEKQRTESREEQSDLNGKSFTVKVRVDQDRYQHCCPEHGKEMLQSENKHFWHTQLPGVSNYTRIPLLCVVHF